MADAPKIYDMTAKDHKDSESFALSILLLAAASEAEQERAREVRTGVQRDQTRT
jgi:hypothetical protein